jgi:hypothetical protein
VAGIALRLPASELGCSPLLDLGARPSWTATGGGRSSGRMSRMVLLERPGLGLVVARVSFWTRVVARLRFATLDQALASGVQPESEPALALRSERLIAPPMRLRLARSLRFHVDAARHRRAPLRAPWPAAPPPLPARGPHVAGAAEELLLLADLLEGFEPVDARGVALVSVLLTDGNSPLHHNRGTTRLIAAARAAADALAPRTETTA